MVIFGFRMGGGGGDRVAFVCKWKWWEGHINTCLGREVVMLRLNVSERWW